jgi:bifunctional non-homologous end joining protein LigD
VQTQVAQKEKGLEKIKGLKLTHPNRILYEKEQLTKLDVAQYYIQVSKLMLPLIKDRPLTLVRCPEGTEKACFYQKHMSESAPDFVDAVEIKEKEKTNTYMSVGQAAGLASLVQMGAFEFHAWNSTANHLEKPDQIVMDFDPGPMVPWKKVINAAFELKEILDSLGLHHFVKLSGGKGLHVHIPFKPLYTWDQVKEFSKALALQLEKSDSKFYVTKMSKSAREGKLFIDYLRNARGATAVAPYSLRAKEISSVAMPLSWQELKTVDGPQAFSLKETLSYLKKRHSDPWADYFHELQELPHMKVQD